MRVISLVPALVLTALLPAIVLAESAPAREDDPLATFGWLRELAGSCWRGEHPGGKVADTQCYQTQYGRFLRGTIHIVSIADGVETPRLAGDSIYWWDASRGVIALTTWADQGAVVTGEARIEGDAIRFYDPKREGKAATRSTWKRLDAESFQVTRESEANGEWKQTLLVTYRRAGAAGAR